MIVLETHVTRSTTITWRGVYALLSRLILLLCWQGFAAAPAKDGNAASSDDQAANLSDAATSGDEDDRDSDGMRADANDGTKAANVASSNDDATLSDDATSSDEDGDSDILKEWAMKMDDYGKWKVQTQVQKQLSAQVKVKVKRCKCGSVSHSKTTHFSCPLNGPPVQIQPRQGVAIPGSGLLLAAGSPLERLKRSKMNK